MQKRSILRILKKPQTAPLKRMPLALRPRLVKPKSQATTHLTSHQAGHTPQAWGRHWRMVGALALAWPLGLSVHAQQAGGPSATNSTLPALGDAASQELSPMAERRLGDRIMRSIWRDPDVIDDPMVLEYVNDVWTTLLQSARRRGEITPELDASHAWQPFLVRDRSINAFALPGGYIGVHFGLLAMTTTPDELASVLAHELSHVTQRHIARMMAQQARTSWVGMASLILGVLAASRNPEAAQAMIYGGQAASIQGQLNFSRDMEREADRVGFGVLSDAGYEPGGMALMFEHLQQASRLNDDGSFPYLRTHPLTTERIGEARSRIGITGWNLAAQAGHPLSARWAWHVLMAARSRVLMDTRGESLQALVNLEPHANDSALTSIATLYTRAVALQRSANPVHAQAALQRASQIAMSLPAEQQAVVLRALGLSQAQSLLDESKPQEALALIGQLPLRTGGLSSPAKRPELLLTAQAALALPDVAGQAGAWQDAASRLQTHVNTQPQDAAAWSTLGHLWEHLGQPLRAVRADAESSAALGDLPGAIDRIEGAQKRFRQPNAADVIELSVMSSRLKAWQRQQREDMREEGGA